MILAAEYLGLLSYSAAYALVVAKKFNFIKVNESIKFTSCLIAVFTYGILLYQWIDTPLGHNINLFNIVSMIMWIMTIVLLLAATIHPVDNLLLLIIPATLFTMIFNILSPTASEMRTVIDGPETMHIFLALISISMLTVTGLQSGLLAIQNYLLKTNPLHKLHSFLPPLERNEKIWVLFLYISFIILTITLLEAIIYLDNFEAVSVKLLFSVISWLVLFVILWKHYNTGYKGMRSEMWSILAFILLTWAYFGSKIFLGYN
ncbi:MAG: cytochrome c biogenesis protein CcsA [Francisellaceae bacterium]|jgi:ABC-type uncharacterized transport system permease subunit|nr:cytochrome c biogenesis protein CcsA [Francisellaceae bacterium]MBT6207958.1 cytochrome c biogenesis protein CcsA [Francisellaceae bacterium]MBT6539903.1 cytochrome c biogenesis protein CcsA [Francisellaceae bacterium]